MKQYGELRSVASPLRQVYFVAVCLKFQRTSRCRLLGTAGNSAISVQWATVAPSVLPGVAAAPLDHRAGSGRNQVADLSPMRPVQQADPQPPGTPALPPAWGFVGADPRDGTIRKGRRSDNQTEIWPNKWCWGFRETMRLHITSLLGWFNAQLHHEIDTEIYKSWAHHLTCWCMDIFKNFFTSESPLQLCKIFIEHLMSTDTYLAEVTC